MKYTYLLFLFIASSCAIKVIPLKGKYLDKPYEILTDKQFDKVWDDLIDLFAKNGLPIKIIDRSSGLIISDKTIFPITVEDKNGVIKDKAAYIVVPSVYYPGPRKYYPYAYPSEFTGEWNVRIKKVGNQVSVNVNMVNVKHLSAVVYGQQRKELISTQHKSTGVFEKMIADFITK